MENFSVPGYFIASLIVMLIIMIFAIVVGVRVKKLKIGDKPSKVLTIVISFVSFMNKTCKKNVGTAWKFVAPIIITLSVYLFCLNIAGMFGLPTPTAYTSITVTFAIFAFFIIQGTSIYKQKMRHLKTFISPIPVMLPINILSDLTPLISMTLRLFGSIASGAALIGLVYQLLGWFSPLVTPPLHVIFDIAFGFLQCMVYVLLTIIFASNKLELTEEDYQLIEEIGEN